MLKNVMVIVVGVVEVLGLGYNVFLVIIIRGLVESTRLVCVMGG